MCENGSTTTNEHSYRNFMLRELLSPDPIVITNETF